MEFAKDLVSLFDGKPMTTSRLVAKKFGKRHDNVLQLFNSRIVGRHSDEFVALNFQVNEYIDGAGRMNRELLMTKDGFVAIATKLRGAELWQEQFIAAFNAMTEQLERISLNLWTRRMALETRDSTSHAKASFGSRLMLERKREIPAIRSERDALNRAMQPGLPLH